MACQQSLEALADKDEGKPSMQRVAPRGSRAVITRRHLLSGATLLAVTRPAARAAQTPDALSNAAGDLVIALDSPVTVLDPSNTGSNSSLSAGRLIFEGLYGFDKSMTPIPVLAEDFSANSDATEFVFKLRRGIYFHDRTQFDAQAVKVNIERIMDPANHLTRASLLSAVDHVQVVDDYAVQVVLKTSFGAFLPTAIIYLSEGNPTWLPTPRTARPRSR